ncbi:LPS translocon maturation chaperone LptM [Oryzibacter oryziterrae]|uniref:LPS translocon maturation chaperone LptM n=1 Tax=Oryzibacter oryziterrae TaxID=2766474 RepID=UPI001F32D2DE|nr:lipoprotein [Oryzibacter oryziterrae]
MQRRVLTLLLVLLSLAACGRRGDLDRPNATEPAPATSSDPGAVQPEPQKAPDKPFFLDPLI